MGTGPVYENERTPDMPEWNNPQEVLRFASRLTGLGLGFILKGRFNLTTIQITANSGGVR